MTDETTQHGASAPAPEGAAPGGGTATPGEGSAMPDLGAVSGLAGDLAPVPPAGRAELTPEERAQVEQIKRAVDVEDAQTVLQYGLPAQNKIATFADTLLADIRTREAGQAGESLAELLVKVKEVDVDSLGGGSGLAKIPLVGRFVDSFNRFANRYQKIGATIEKLTLALEKARMGLLKDITVLDRMYELNLEYLGQLDLYIAAGDELLEELQSERLPALEAEAQASQDPLDAQHVNDVRQAVLRFERRLHDLKLTRMIAIQTAPQVRLIQSNDQNLVEKIQSSILTTVPLWKNQIVIALSLYRQQKALELQREVSDTTNELLAKNAALLKDGSAKVAREVERGVVDIETLRQVNADLVATLEETISIQDEGRRKRHEAEDELVRLQADLRKKLIELRGAQGAEPPRLRP
ncbi:MAG: toxic anion resistance protein [Thermoleophilia bacterium]|nr:toxic anion resistance protein [Thermoleophilia bacterium]